MLFLRRAVVFWVPFAALTPRINPRLLLPFAGSAWRKETATGEATNRSFTGGGFFPPDPRRESPALAGWRVALRRGVLVLSHTILRSQASWNSAGPLAQYVTLSLRLYGARFLPRTASCAGPLE